MDDIDYPLICYWGGEVVEKQGHVHYKGGQRRPVLVKRSMKYAEIENKLYELMGFNRRIVGLKVKMKYPIPGGFIALALDDENSLLAMWACVAQMSTPSMEIYVEHVPVNPMGGASAYTNQNMESQPCSSSYPQSSFLCGGSFTRMLTDDRFTYNHLDELTSPQQSPHYRTPIDLDAMQGGVNDFTETMNLVRSEDGTNINNLATYMDSQTIDEDADTDVDNEILDALEDDDDSDRVSPTAPTPYFTMVNDIPLELYDSWKTCLGNQSFTPESEFEVGHVFDNKNQLQDMVKLYSIKRNQFFRVVESDKNTWAVECKRKKECKCSWKLRGSKKHPEFDNFTIVRYVGPHSPTCVAEIGSMDHSHLTSAFVSSQIRDLVRIDPSIKVRVIVQYIKDKFDFTITYRRAWIAKKKAMADVFGDWEKSYTTLPQFMQALQESNPGTVVSWCTIDTACSSVKIFQRVFWAFKPSIEGFKQCRPLITIDGTHLYGKYKGTLLIAMGSDANTQLFPLAFAIVEGENGESWPWFMACIRRFVTNRPGLCVISDRHAGIIMAMKESGSGWEEPYAHHRLCIRHLSSNVNTRYKDTYLKNLCFKTAEEHQEKKFDKGFKRIKVRNQKAHQYLSKLPPCQWSLYHDGGFRYGTKTTNMAEVFNSVMKGARFLPVTALVQISFFRVNGYFVHRRGWGKRRLEEGYQYSERVTNLINRNIQKSNHHTVHTFDSERGLFQIETGQGNRKAGKGGKRHTVDLQKRTCTCEKIQIYKFPCSHVLAVCRERSLDYKSFVDPYYCSPKYAETYSCVFNPIPDPAYWSRYEGPTIIANASMQRGRGRPRSTRIRNEMDEGTPGKVTCSNCREKGHNKKTCSRRTQESADGTS